MTALTFRLKLLEPVLVTSLDGDPNSAVAFDFIPGSTLRGALVGRWLERKGHTRPRERFDLAGDLEARRLFLDGTTRYLNGYPYFAGQRSLPSPLSWRVTPVARELLWDLAAPAAREALRGVPGAESPDDWSSMKKPFCAAGSDAGVHLGETRRQLAIHTARNREFGRPQAAARVPEADDEPGEIYRYAALAAGQEFAAAIVSDDEELLKTLEDLLKPRDGEENELLLGGSHTAGYGRACLHSLCRVADWRERSGPSSSTLEETAWSRDPEDEEDEWAGAVASAEPPPVRRVVVTLLSDLLLSDPGSGAPVTDVATLGRLLAERLKVDPGRVHATGYLAARPVAGFNRAWGLPLPQQPALRMGGVIVLEGAEWDLSICAAMEADGLGERRAEGFGRLSVLCDPLSPLRECFRTEGVQDVTVALEPGTQAARLAERMAARIWRRALDARVSIEANGTLGERAGSALAAISPAQLSRLRSVVVAQLRRAGDAQTQLQHKNAEDLLEPVRDYLREAFGRPAIRRQYQRARVGELSVAEWLRDILDGDPEERKSARLQRLFDVTPPQIGGIRAALSRELQGEYRLRYLEAVLARAVKLRRQGEER